MTASHSTEQVGGQPQAPSPAAASPSHADVFGAPSDQSHADVFGLPGSLASRADRGGLPKEPNERAWVEGLYALLGARELAQPPSMFGEPAWYRERCEAVSRAVWRDEVTASEASQLLVFGHALLYLEMAQRKLWKRPRRGSGRRRPKRVLFRFRRARCERCSGRLQPFSGWCVACWRPGREKGRKQ
jgi:hypothetical protein